MLSLLRWIDSPGGRIWEMTRWKKLKRWYKICEGNGERDRKWLRNWTCLFFIFYFLFMVCGKGILLLTCRFYGNQSIACSCCDTLYTNWNVYFMHILHSLYLEFIYAFCVEPSTIFGAHCGFFIIAQTLFSADKRFCCRMFCCSTGPFYSPRVFVQWTRFH